MKVGILAIPVKTTRSYVGSCLFTSQRSLSCESLSFEVLQLWLDLHISVNLG